MRGLLSGKKQPPTRHKQRRWPQPWTEEVVRECSRIGHNTLSLLRELAEGGGGSIYVGAMIVDHLLVIVLDSKVGNRSWEDRFRSVLPKELPFPDLEEVWWASGRVECIGERHIATQKEWFGTDGGISPHNLVWDSTYNGRPFSLDMLPMFNEKVLSLVCEYAKRVAPDFPWEPVESVHLTSPY